MKKRDATIIVLVWLGVIATALIGVNTNTSSRPDVDPEALSKFGVALIEALSVNSPASLPYKSTLNVRQPKPAPPKPKLDTTCNPGDIILKDPLTVCGAVEVL